MFCVKQNIHPSFSTMWMGSLAVHIIGPQHLAVSTCALVSMRSFLNTFARPVYWVWILLYLLGVLWFRVDDFSIALTEWPSCVLRCIRSTTLWLILRFILSKDALKTAKNNRKLLFSAVFRVSWFNKLIWLFQKFLTMTVFSENYWKLKLMRY